MYGSCVIDREEYWDVCPLDSTDTIRDPDTCTTHRQSIIKAFNSLIVLEYPKMTGKGH